MQSIGGKIIAELRPFVKITRYRMQFLLIESTVITGCYPYLSSTNSLRVHRPRLGYTDMGQHQRQRDYTFVPHLALEAFS